MTSAGSAADGTLFADPLPEPEGAGSQKAVNWATSPEIHRSFRFWDKVPPAQLRRLLTSLYPVSMSESNLLSLRKAGQREMPRGIALDIFEFVFGEDPAFMEVGAERSFEKVVLQMKDP